MFECGGDSDAPAKTMRVNISASIRDSEAFIAWSLLCAVIGRRRVPGDPDDLVPAGLEGPAAFGVFAGEDAGVLATEGADAGGGFQEVGEGHGWLILHPVCNVLIGSVSV